VPAWGGSARLERRIGLKATLDVVLTGRSLEPRKAARLGLVDAVASTAALPARAREILLGDRPPRPEPRQDRADAAPLLHRAEEKIRARGGDHYPAPLRFLEVLRASPSHDPASPEATEAEEVRAVGELVTGPVCKNLLHMFRLTHEAKRHPAFEPRPALSVPPRPAGIERAGVVGAGVMGRGISTLLVQAGLPVVLKDLRQETLKEASNHVLGLLENRRNRRRLSPTVSRQTAHLLHPVLDDRAFGEVQLVVEAIPESLETKARVLRELAAVVPATTILASNTSSLSIDDLAEDVPHPERVLGLHFLNPAHRMPLVEIVAGRRTAPEVIAAAVGLIHRLGKTAVAVQNAPGFLVNRLLTFYLSGALWLLDEGHTVEELDRILTDWGMPQGPFALMDRVGIDLAVSVGQHLMEAFGERLAFPDWDWEGVFLEPGHLGAKTGAGFYRYRNGRRLNPAPEILHRLGREHRNPRPLSPTQVVDHLLLPMVDEAARCLEEGVVAGAADVDVAVLLGLGFPPFRGGLCRWADQRGLEDIVGALPRPSKALRRLARGGGFYDKTLTT
jgi:3-hydroxyacyl-CoA dehydrogenase